jgi:hypothetical protein
MPDSDVVLFTPGDEFHAIAPEDLLPRLRVDPAASPVNLMQCAFTVYIDDVEYDVDPDTAFGRFEAILSITGDNTVGYVISRCGDWWTHWAADAVDEYVAFPGMSPGDAVDSLILRSGMYELIQDAEWTWRIRVEGEPNRV